MSGISTPEKIKAAYLKKALEVTLKEENLPTLGPHDVLVKVMAVGICGSDLHYYEFGKNAQKVVSRPIRLGHESSGVVAAVGEAVSRFKPGDRVAIEPGVACGKCSACKGGRYNLCPKVAFLGSPPVDGALIQYIRHPEDYLFALPDDVSFEEAALIEPFSVAIHACRRAKLQPGSTVSIAGMGPVGLLTVVAAKYFGAKSIIVSDLEASRLEVAKDLGATHAVQVSKEDALAVVAEVTNGLGVDVAFETAGSVKALHSALRMVRRGGQFLLVGMPPTDEVEFDIPLISSLEIDVYGVYRYANTYPIAIKMLSEIKGLAQKLVTHRFPLEETKEALECARTNKSKSLKIMIYPNGFTNYN
ncbi:NAD(P)-dependent alcohol dehydrogenase [Alicyclobacillus dauci]|uniref:NAD(P)-dependent alcohol dehydrogenase n=1 Tax=Alicyclobacillus dauci TaxID=1475485 RepID=A0ABY6Z716_9BACL|nr:NAD(P)-dependent alcohol dehydrogenase [Alicyclobacillus dauci]WAH37961.1 NAD(P)-dependent alcohol dehydrogenase [Alicyclobacillus dauci]